MEFSQARNLIPDLLSQHLQLEVVRDVLVPERIANNNEGYEAPDLLAVFNGYRFAIEYKYRSRAEQVGQAVRQIKHWGDDSDAIPLLVVPYMGEVGRKLCEGAGISWMDLSGNAWIHRGHIHITILGRENKFKKRGRPANLFAPKSARIIRTLLVNHDRSYRQSELADLSGVDPGHVSRVVKRLEESGFISRDPSDQKARVKDPDLLLDAWVDEYEFDDHEVLAGHISSRSPVGTLRRLDEAFQSSNAEYALTGLPAAWLYVRHSGYRLVTLYVKSTIEDSILDRVGWRPQERGGNVWVLHPRDEGVFYGSKILNGFPCVSAVQTYLDLRHLPERSEEAAGALRKELLWPRLSGDAPR